MTPYLGLVLAYVVGSIPAAYIAGKVTRGIDLRQHGSGNLGATNVYRVLGAKTAIVVLLFDAAKGALPALWFPRLFGIDRAGPHAVTLWAIAFRTPLLTSLMWPSTTAVRRALAYWLLAAMKFLQKATR